MSRPDLLVLDEPTNGLDPLVQNEFMTILGEVAALGTSILMSSHILSEVELIADAVVLIQSGVIVADGSTGRLRRGAAQVFRAVFTGRMPDPALLSALEGTEAVESPEPRELCVHWSGPPSPLLAELSRYELESLTAPEPDLETAFLSYYRTDQAEQAAASDRASTQRSR
jgi:ABC-2 type transport system ATP-binding protein